MTRKTRTIIIISILIIASTGMFVYTNVYNKPHIDVSTSKPNISIKAGALLDGFLTNETEANSKYLEQIIEVNGTIAEITTDKNGNAIIALRKNNDIESVICHVLPEENTKTSNLKIGQEISIKGICTGYLMDVILVKCVIIN